MSAVTIERHLARWGLRQWPDEASYDVWQRQSLAGDRLRLLRHAAQRRREGGEGADQAFYDLAASPDMLPVLHSQRYGYYLMLAPVIADVLAGARRVLDVGCGVGILTTWYAARFPDVAVLGIDRSLSSLEAARRFAHSSRLENVRFQRCDMSRQEMPAGFDTIVVTQALFQSESDPGLPSRHWSTFERDRDGQQQRRLERRTGLGTRIDCVSRALAPSGRVVLFEKAVHRGRRVLFQRALGARGLVPIAAPRLLTYAELGESVEEGPLYVMRRGASRAPSVFDEHVSQDPQEGLYRCSGQAVAESVYARLPKDDVRRGPVAVTAGAESARYETGRTGGGLCYVCLMIHGVCEVLLLGVQALQPFMVELAGHALWEERSARPAASPENRCTRAWPEPESHAPEQAPVYEHHGPVAEQVWRTLPERAVVRERTDAEEDGRQRHIEYGRCAGAFHYVYWANTYDQRQIVMMEYERRALLEAYYAESVGDG